MYVGIAQRLMLVSPFVSFHLSLSQSVSLNVGFTGLCLYRSGITGNTAMPGVLHGYWRLTSGSCGGMVGTFSAEPHPQPPRCCKARHITLVPEAAHCKALAGPGS